MNNTTLLQTFLCTFLLQFRSVAQPCPTLCNTMDCSMLGLPVHPQLPELAQTPVHWVSDAIQPSHRLSSSSPPAFNLSQHQGLSKWVSSSHCYAQSPSPQNWENMSTAMQKHKGVLLPARARAPVSSTAVESWREPRAQIYRSIYKFRTKTGSWQGLIGCRVSWYLLIGQLSSLWLARVIIPLIGQSYHPRKPRKHDSGIIFGLVHLSEPVMALVRL